MKVEEVGTVLCLVSDLASSSSEGSLLVAVNRDCTCINELNVCIVVSHVRNSNYNNAMYFCLEAKFSSVRDLEWEIFSWHCFEILIMPVTIYLFRIGRKRAVVFKLITIPSATHCCEVVWAQELFRSVFVYRSHFLIRRYLKLKQTRTNTITTDNNIFSSHLYNI